MKDKSSVFGLNMKQKREEKGLSQIDLAKQMCIANNSITRYEAGKVTPNVLLAKDIAQALDCSLDELCGLDSTDADTELIALANKASLLPTDKKRPLKLC